MKSIHLQINFQKKYGLKQNEQCILSYHLQLLMRLSFYMQNAAFFSIQIKISLNPKLLFRKLLRKWHLIQYFYKFQLNYQVNYTVLHMKLRN